MISLNGKYIVDEKGERVGVLLSIDEYQRLLEELEELESIRAYDAAKASKDEAIPFDQATSEIEKKRPADQIRQFALLNYIEPARARGETVVSIRAGDIHSQMGLSARLPAVCSALGTNKFVSMCGIKRLSIQGPIAGANTVFTFKL